MEPGPFGGRFEGCDRIAGRKERGERGVQRRILAGFDRANDFPGPARHDVLHPANFRLIGGARIDRDQGLGDTYAGPPIACAAALAVLDVIEDKKLMARPDAQGERTRGRLQAMSRRNDLVPAPPFAAPAR